jgi:predicted lysophospholipase L1 biosynthesis ABC-type transport system permease subunit
MLARLAGCWSNRGHRAAAGAGRRGALRHDSRNFDGAHYGKLAGVNVQHDAAIGLIGIACAVTLALLHRTVVDGVYKIARRGERQAQLPWCRRWALPVTERNAAITAWALIALIFLISLIYLATGLYAAFE